MTMEEAENRDEAGGEQTMRAKVLRFAPDTPPRTLALRAIVCSVSRMVNVEHCG